MRKLYLLFVLLIVTAWGNAKERTLLQAKQVALEFRNQKAGDIIPLEQVNENPFSLKMRARLRGKTMPQPYYIFNLPLERENGFVVVSGHDELVPIIGYGISANDNDELPVAMQEWLDGYARQIDWLLQHSGEVESHRAGYSKAASTRAAQCEPLLGNMIWDQDEPYGNYCPMDGEERSAVGCVATAMAMIMNHYQYPAMGQGYNSYLWTDSDGNSWEISADFNVPYRWDLMLDEYNEGEYSEEEADAVAQLCYHCGVAVNMEYSAEGSGANVFSAMTGLVNYFKYNPNLRACFRDYYSADEWNDMVYRELDAGRPLMYGGNTGEEGHMFVIDGYDAEGMFHVNWGWSGDYNGYFRLSLLEPDEGYLYSFDQSLICYFTPDTIGEDEFEFYSNSVGVLPDKVKLGEWFDVSFLDIYNYTNKTFSGDFVLALFDGDMNEIEQLLVFPVSSIDLWMGWNSISGSIALSKQLVDGGYRIATYMRSADSPTKIFVRMLGYGNSNYLSVKIENGEALLNSFSNSDSYSNAIFDDGNYLIFTTVEDEEYYLTLEDSLVLCPKSGLANQVWRMNKCAFTSDTRMKDSAYVLQNASNGMYFKNRGILSAATEGTFTAHPIFVNKAGDYAIKMTNDRVIDSELMTDCYMSVDQGNFGVSTAERFIPDFTWKITDAGPLAVKTVNGCGRPTLINGIWHNPARYDLTVFDVNGRVVATSHGDFDTAGLKQGVYVLRCAETNSIMKFKR